MIDYSAKFRDCLSSLDIDGMRKLWAHTAPHLPQPNSDAEILMTIHHARTQANSMTIKQRAYSHAWLIERGLPSGLPDNLKPRATRLYPIVVKAVGISVNFRSEWMKPAATEVRQSMEAAVMDAHAHGRIGDNEFVRERMQEARAKTMKKLFGRGTS